MPRICFNIVGLKRDFPEIRLALDRRSVYGPYRLGWLAADHSQVCVGIPTALVVFGFETTSMNASLLLGVLVLLPGGPSVKSMRRCTPPMYLLQSAPVAIPVTPRLAAPIERAPILAPTPVEADAAWTGRPAAPTEKALPVAAVTIERDAQLADHLFEQTLAMADGIIDGIPVGLVQRFNAGLPTEYINGLYIQDLGLWGLAEIGPGVLYPQQRPVIPRTGGPGGGFGGGRGSGFATTFPGGGTNQAPEPGSILVWSLAAGLAVGFRLRRRSANPITTARG